jgi:hypothetical protein
MKNKKFKIDFFEFSFLVEACIPEQPIARSMFWDEVINVYYHEMTKDERVKLYKWINRNFQFEKELNKGNKQCIAFNARFNPDNQYLVHYTFNDKKDTVECFKIGDTYYTEYYTSRQQYISNIFIDKIEKLNL